MSRREACVSRRMSRTWDRCLHEVSPHTRRRTIRKYFRAYRAGSMHFRSLFPPDGIISLN